MNRVTGSTALAGLVLAGFEGTTPFSDELNRLNNLGVGGFIVFARNVQDPLQVHGLLAELHSMRATENLLFAVDQEGGRVARLREPLTVWPAMEKLGASADPELATLVGRALASELAALGFNVNFAPVLDVRCTDTTIAIGDRAISEQTAVVSSIGTALIKGIQSAGVMACAKHFPGHGKVAADSHYELPVSPLDEASWRADHLPPFSAAINSGVAAVMTAHVVYPGLNGRCAATLSPAIMTDILRGELGFQGVLFSDDLGMGAITDQGGIGEAAVAAIRAGVDGLLVCRHLDAVEEVVEALHRTADEDPKFATRCQQSLDRLAAAAGKHPPQPLTGDTLDGLLGCAEHQAISARLGALAQGLDPTLGHDDRSQAATRHSADKVPPQDQA
ncbi:MAG: beta-N-acetylhexosaminidase [Rickettsiales bacterium]|nr:beta-N-acetylhexosaminidase [Rickettsiales bacterium]